MSAETEKADIRTPPRYDPDGPPQTLTPDTARQAPQGRRIFWVLLFGTLGIIIAFAVVYSGWFVANQ